MCNDMNSANRKYRNTSPNEETEDTYTTNGVQPYDSEMGTLDSRQNDASHEQKNNFFQESSSEVSDQSGDFCSDSSSLSRMRPMTPPGRSKNSAQVTNQQSCIIEYRIYCLPKQKVYKKEQRDKKKSILFKGNESCGKSEDVSEIIKVYELMCYTMLRNFDLPVLNCEQRAEISYTGNQADTILSNLCSYKIRNNSRSNDENQ